MCLAWVLRALVARSHPMAQDVLRVLVDACRGPGALSAARALGTVLDDAVAGRCALNHWPRRFLHSQWVFSASLPLVSERLGEAGGGEAAWGLLRAQAWLIVSVPPAVAQQALGAGLPAVLASAFQALRAPGGPGDADTMLLNSLLRYVGAVLGARSHWASLPELCYCMRASMLLPGLCGPVVPLPLDARAGFGPDAAKAAAEKAAEAASKATDEEHAAAAWRDAMAAAKPSGAAGPLGAPPEPYADAMLYEPIPYRAALAEGATHVLVLRTRPDGVNVVKKQSAFEKLVGHRFFKRKMRLPHVADHMMEQKHRQIYAEDILTLNEGLSAPPPAEGAPQLLPIALQPGERGPEVSNLQTACAPLYHAVRCGFARAYDVLAPAGAPDGWDVATEIFDDEILKEIEKKQKAPI